MPEALDIKLTFGSDEASQVQRSQITGGVIQKHIFTTRIRGIDAAVIGTGVPFVDCGIVLDAGIRTDPCSPGNTIPKVPGFDSFAHLSIGSPSEIPIFITFHGLKKPVWNSNAVIRILS